jgi:hypothetical protein
MQFLAFVLIVGIAFALFAIVIDNSHPNHPK